MLTNDHIATEISSNVWAHWAVINRKKRQFTEYIPITLLTLYEDTIGSQFQNQLATCPDSYLALKQFSHNPFDENPW